MAVGTVYRYFDSKDALVAEIMHGDWDPALERMSAAAAEVESPIEPQFGLSTAFYQQVNRTHSPFRPTS